MSTEPAYAGLQSPLSLGATLLRNRVVHASTATLMAQDGQVSERLLAYYESRAKGGAAMIVTEPVSAMARQHQPIRLRAFDDVGMDGLARLANAVEGRGCRLVAQLMERGRGRNLPGRTPNAVGASALPDDLSWTMPRMLETEEIEDLVRQFTACARRLQGCGFSGVEVSAAHGHLFHQFLSPWSNRRDDGYGGDLAGRTRIVRELVGAIRSACGSGFLVGLKLPGDDGVPGSIAPEEAGAIASTLAATGSVDYVCFAQGAHARSLEMHVPDGHAPRVPYLDLLRALRPTLNGLPMMALGRITDPAEGEGLIQRGDADLVAMSRALIADPAWMNKAAAGRAYDIRYCVSCNTCWQRVSALQMPLACDNNPRVACEDEVDFRPRRALHDKRVVVVGAGAAGLEAAWVAATRGHAVTVFGRTGEAGGKARLRALLPGGEGVSSVYDYQMQQALRAGVRFEFGVEAGMADILAMQPHEVVLAAGADMVPPDWIPEALRQEQLVPDLRRVSAELLQHAARRAPGALQSVQRGTAVLFDMDHTEGTYAAAELLHALFEGVVIVTPRDSVAQDAPLVVRQGVLRRLSLKRIRVLALSQPRWSPAFEAQGQLDTVNVYNGDVTPIDDVALLTWATPRASANALDRPLRSHGLPVHLVGDCRSSRALLDAIAEGHAAGNSI